MKIVYYLAERTPSTSRFRPEVRSSVSAAKPSTTVAKYGIISHDGSLYPKARTGFADDAILGWSNRYDKTDQNQAY